MDGQEESSNVEDARGSGSGGFSLGGGRGIGLGTVAVALVAGWVFGINPMTILGLLSGGGQGTQVASTAQPTAPPAGDPQTQFVSRVLRSTEVVWTDVFKQAGKQYVDPKLTLYRDSYPTACGQGEAAMGPFYCPGDRKVYLDLGFFDTMSTKLGAPGQFAQAYVIAHEVGHHVQNLLGLTDKADAARQRGSEAAGNAISVKIELQADCFAGVWAKRSQQEQGWRLDPGDIDTALNAASQIGDDTLQRKMKGRVVPETFTHGTSAQRVGWFQRGFTSGDWNQCNTFRGGVFVSEFLTETSRSVHRISPNGKPVTRRFNTRTVGAQRQLKQCGFGRDACLDLLVHLLSTQFVAVSLPPATRGIT